MMIGLGKRDKRFNLKIEGALGLVMARVPGGVGRRHK